MSIFEAIMLMCFGAAWPFSIAKSWRSRQNGGKSIAFLGVILVGYISGATHKVLYDFDPVIGLYVVNGIMVAVDIAIYLRNARLATRPRAA